MTTRTPLVNSRLRGFTGTIFAEMSALADATGSINLGQGYPDVDGPDLIKRAAIRAIERGDNQYPPGNGIGALRTAIAAHQYRFYGLDVDPATEVLVTAGATEAIAATLLGLCEPGDEVIMFEPYYDAYAACTAMAGAERRVVPLRAPEWSFDPAALEAAVSDTTRMILVNTPHNPTGKVFTRAELQVIADVCQRHDIIAVVDEVYEHLVYDAKHVALASLPGMADRTITISSAAKTFSFTGWKIGWVCARAELTAAVRAAKQFLTYVNGAPFQHAIAEGLDACDDYLVEAVRVLRDKRDFLGSGLDAAGFGVLDSAGTFFLTTDISGLTDEDPYDFCRALPARCGLVAIPSPVFYDDKHAGAHYVRWMFSKRPDVLEEAVRRLARLRRTLSLGTPG